MLKRWARWDAATKFAAISAALAAIAILGGVISWTADGMAVWEKLRGGENPPAPEKTAPAPSDSQPPAEPSTADSGEQSLLDASPVEGSSYVTVGSATVGGEAHPRALVFPGTAKTTYSISGGRNFHARAGMDDASQDCTTTFELLVDGEPKKRVTIGRGEVVDLTGDLGSGARLTLSADTAFCSATPVLLEPVLRP